MLVCSGKVFYDLDAHRRNSHLSNTAIVRVERLYPFPEHELSTELGRYPADAEVLWVQEEPENQGAWPFLGPRIQRLTKRPIGCISRAQAPAPRRWFRPTARRRAEGTGRGRLPLTTPAAGRRTEGGRARHSAHPAATDPPSNTAEGGRFVEPWEPSAYHHGADTRGTGTTPKPYDRDRSRCLHDLASSHAHRFVALTGCARRCSPPGPGDQDGSAIARPRKVWGTSATTTPPKPAPLALRGVRPSDPTRRVVARDQLDQVPTIPHAQCPIGPLSRVHVPVAGSGSRRIPATRRRP